MTTKAVEPELTVIIGLEVHVQLETATKIFCGCSTEVPEQPNTNVCPVCLGLPGALPALNEEAVRSAIKIGKALNADIPEETVFHRKNYFYPDLPKGFQISQYDAPICEGGELSIMVEGTERVIQIERAHLEEDPGSLQHVGGSIDSADYTRIDYNRAGTPLIEIVTAPDLRSPNEVRVFLKKLEEVLEYLGVFDAGRDGSLRVDANISLVESESVSDAGRPSGEALEAANRTEVKNISSYRGAEKALAFEISRQKNALRHGRSVQQETRHWDEDKGITLSMRAKEAEKDYRYFREADLPALRVAGWREKVEIPELPDARRERFTAEYQLSAEEASKLTTTKATADFFEEVAREFDPDQAATWVADNLLGELNYRDLSIADVEHQLDDFKQIIELVSEGEITQKNAEEIVLRELLDTGDSPGEIVERENLRKAGESIVEEAVVASIDENPEVVDDYLSGEENAINYLVGQVMQKTSGRADPETVNTLLRERIPVE